MMMMMALAPACGGSNEPPVIAGSREVTTDEDTPVTWSLQATDPDGDMLFVGVAQQPARGGVTSTGLQVTFTPDPNASGPDQVTLRVSDGDATADATFTIQVASVNDPPAGGADSFAADEDTPLPLTTGMVLQNDTDVDGDALSVTAVATGTGGTVALAGADITFTPDTAFTGDASFTYTLSDGVTTADVVVTIAVGGVNDAPVAVDDNATVGEDMMLDIAASSLTANDTDAEGQTLTVTAVAGATNGTVTLAGTTVQFAPAPDFAGTASFQYTVTDGVDTDTGTVAVTVTPVNDPPIANDDVATTTTDTALVIPGATLTGNDTDVDGPALAVTAVANATNGTVALAGGDVTFTPDAGFVGTASFQYTVSDGTASDTGTVTVTVSP